MTQSTAFVLVPGAYCPASFYHKVTAKLSDLGYSVHETDLLSVGERAEGPATMYDDAEHIHSVIAKLADQGKNVVLGMTSYGGVPGTEASKGLSRSERQTVGRRGALVGLVYIASLLPPVGLSTHDLVGGFTPVSTESVSEYVDGPDPETAGQYICTDLTEGEQKHYARQLKCQSSVSFTSKLTYAGYGRIPTTILVSEHDRAVPVKVQHENVDNAVSKGLAIKKLIVQSDHCIMISHPTDVVEALLKAAE